MAGRIPKLPAPKPRTRGRIGMTAYSQQSHARLIEEAQKLAAENGGRLPAGYAISLGARTGYTPESVEVILSGYRRGAMGSAENVKAAQALPAVTRSSLDWARLNARADAAKAAKQPLPTETVVSALGSSSPAVAKVQINRARGGGYGPEAQAVAERLQGSKSGGYNVVKAVPLVLGGGAGAGALAMSAEDAEAAPLRPANDARLLRRLFGHPNPDAYTMPAARTGLNDMSSAMGRQSLMRYDQAVQGGLYGGNANANTSGAEIDFLGYDPDAGTWFMDQRPKPPPPPPPPTATERARGAWGVDNPVAKALPLALGAGAAATTMLPEEAQAAEREARIIARSDPGPLETGARFVTETLDPTLVGLSSVNSLRDQGYSVPEIVQRLPGEAKTQAVDLGKQMLGYLDADYARRAGVMDLRTALREGGRAALQAGDWIDQKLTGRGPDPAVRRATSRIPPMAR